MMFTKVVGNLFSWPTLLTTIQCFSQRILGRCVSTFTYVALENRTITICSVQLQTKVKLPAMSVDFPTRHDSWINGIVFEICLHVGLKVDSHKWYRTVPVLNSPN